MDGSTVARLLKPTMSSAADCSQEMLLRFLQHDIPPQRASDEPHEGDQPSMKREASGAWQGGAGQSSGTAGRRTSGTGRRVGSARLRQLAALPATVWCLVAQDPRGDRQPPSTRTSEAGSSSSRAPWARRVLNQGTR